MQLGDAINLKGSSLIDATLPLHPVAASNSFYVSGPDAALERVSSVLDCILPEADGHEAISEVCRLCFLYAVRLTEALPSHVVARDTDSAVWKSTWQRGCYAGAHTILQYQTGLAS